MLVSSFIFLYWDSPREAFHDSQFKKVLIYFIDESSLSRYFAIVSWPRPFVDICIFYLKYKRKCRPELGICEAVIRKCQKIHFLFVN